MLKAGFGLCGCAVCGGAGLAHLASQARADSATHVAGAGYELRFVGAQRETIMNGKLAAVLDLRTLADTPHLYGIGPLEQLRGEVTIADSRPSLSRVDPNGAVQVTESFAAGVPFFVWAQVPKWQIVSIPPEVRSFADLEAFVPRAAAAAGLDPQKPLPFLIRGREEFIEFHVLNRIGDPPHDMATHRKIQVVFELARAEAILVGFHSTGHRGIFTPMDTPLHIHFLTADNSKSGHVQKLELGKDLLLNLPSS
jgi:acetolactate decarboxylase